MTRPRTRALDLGSLLIVVLLVGTALLSGCGPEGAGTIHIESSQARRQRLQTGAGPLAAVPDKSQHAEAPRKSLPGSAVKKPTPPSR